MTQTINSKGFVCSDHLHLRKNKLPTTGGEKLNLPTAKDGQITTEEETSFKPAKIKSLQTQYS